ncbi:ABC transporter substrate-binding protein [Subtercola lobariae]|uniref:Peptide ABC transporter substrate-binding protein n=1 Tax=Subtercola lobariae TaxID=1588641 RepID=A0A917EX86_9MICO|nr:ABC transporter substrate-binding protein [Subtercola lobariae]GGF18411.1 peptide ABC transporter substrate-binding protein [Subtercola lobariae]
MAIKKVQRRTAVLLAIVTSGVLALAGCSAGTPDSTDSGSAQQGDTLTVATPYSAKSLDPTGEGVDPVNALYIIPAYDSLTRMTADGQIQPDLATSWAYSDNNTTFQLTIRDGVKFADGTPLTADAVAQSLNYSRANGVNKNFLGTVTDVTASGPDTVVIKTSTPNDSLPSILSQRFRLASIMNPTGIANPESMKSSTFGAGPYVLDAQDTVVGDHYTYVPSTNYWDPSKIHWKKIVLKVAGTTATALQAVQNGEAELMNGDATTGTAAQASGLTVSTGAYGLTGINVQDRDGTIVPALKDPRVRQALSYAVDRNAIATAVYNGYGVPGASMVVKGFPGYEDNLDAAYSYDPEKAKSLLAEAGYPDGISFDVSTGSIQNTNLMAQAVVQQWAQVGIKANLTTYTDQNQMYADILAGKYPVSIFTWGGLTPFTDSGAFYTGGKTTMNPFGITDDSITALVTKAQAASGSEASDLYNQAWLAGMQLGYFSNIYTRKAVAISDPAKITGVDIGPTNPIVDIAWTVVPVQ